MKKRVDDYTFDPVAKTVKFNDYPYIDLSWLLIIYNVTTATELWSFADKVSGDLTNGSLTNSVLTLNSGVDTSTMSNTDILHIWIDIPNEYRSDAENMPLPYDFTYDVAVERTFGQNRLVDQNGRLPTVAHFQDSTVFGVLNRLYDSTVISSNGYSGVTFQLSGTWAGTVSFEQSLDGNNWFSLYCNTGSGVNSTSSTGNGVFRGVCSGALQVRARVSAYTSGQVKVNIALTVQNYSAISSAYALGSQTQNLQQRATTYELLDYDAYSQNQISQMKDAFVNADMWNPKGVYYIGDTCNYNGTIYQCILNTTTGYYVPTNTTYWQIDPRQKKTLVTTSTVSAPDTTRVRVEIDMDDYQYRLQEQQVIVQNYMALLALQEQDQNMYGTQAGQNRMGASSYILDEVR